MKSAILGLMLMLSSNVYAGARSITCNGLEVSLFTTAKGSRPYGNSIDLTLLDTYKPYGELVILNKVFTLESNTSHDFRIVYQSQPIERGILAVLQYVDGVHTLSVSRDGKPIQENIICDHGF